MKNGNICDRIEASENPFGKEDKYANQSVLSKRDIKGAIAYMRNHGEYRDVLPAYVSIFENCDNILLLQFPAASNSGGDMIRLFYISRIIHWIPNFTLRVHIKTVDPHGRTTPYFTVQIDNGICPDFTYQRS